ncbi:hypothetical protein, partial [Microcoleus sp.]|uniref:hypothetical protein n=1 Tax=Microcoleus sp. TaxID=44472 RepID=UPI0035943F93
MRVESGLSGVGRGDAAGMVGHRAAIAVNHGKCIRSRLVGHHCGIVCIGHGLAARSGRRNGGRRGNVAPTHGAGNIAGDSTSRACGSCGGL